MVVYANQMPKLDEGFLRSPDIPPRVDVTDEQLSATDNPEMTRQATPAEDFDRRMNCLDLAITAGKLGVSHDVFATAQRYYAFATGQPVEDATAGMSFDNRIEAVITEFIRDERLDGRAIKHAIAECLERLDNQWPNIAADRLLSDEEAEAALAEVFDMEPRK